MLDVCWFFFFKQKTAYEMRISDWSSDVCSSDLKDAAICQAAVSMLAKIGIKVDLLAQTRSKYFAKILRTQSDLAKPPNTSFYMLGWSPGATYDVHNVFESYMASPDTNAGKGQSHAGGDSKPTYAELTHKTGQPTERAHANRSSTTHKHNNT